MTPIEFPEANCTYGVKGNPNIRDVPGFAGEINSGSCEGAECAVVCYEFTEEERKFIAEGGNLFLTCLGGLPPHFHSFSFQQALNPS